ncbi:MAG: serine--tRNA ligase, partial [Clostridia bacterium]|nr:serine--tRNA ligase [Clostridia bacterium]
MLDINLIRTNPELVKENIRRKFQDHKLQMVDEVGELDVLNRKAIQQADSLRGQ